MIDDAPVSEGGCLCGAVRYRVTGAPQSSAICHCRSCRRASGAAAVPWLTFLRSRFRLLTGTPLCYRSSARVVRQFCGRCGTPLTYESEEFADTIDITTTSLDDPNRFPPTREVWLAHKLAWQPAQLALEPFQGSSQPE